MTSVKITLLLLLPLLLHHFRLHFAVLMLCFLDSNYHWKPNSIRFLNSNHTHAQPTKQKQFQYGIRSECTQQMRSRAHFELKFILNELDVRLKKEGRKREWQKGPHVCFHPLTLVSKLSFSSNRYTLSKKCQKSYFEAPKKQTPFAPTPHIQWVSLCAVRIKTL